MDGRNIEIEKEMSDSNNREKIGKCPMCGNVVVNFPKSFGCSNYKNGCKFSIWKNIAGKTITKTIAKELIEKGRTNKIDGFKSKAGKSFSASLVIQADGKIGFEF